MPVGTAGALSASHPSLHKTSGKESVFTHLRQLAVPMEFSRIQLWRSNPWQATAMLSSTICSGAIERWRLQFPRKQLLYCCQCLPYGCSLLILQPHYLGFGDSPSSSATSGNTCLPHRKAVYLGNCPNLYRISGKRIHFLSAVS